MAKPMKQCEHPGCRTLVAYDTRYCEKHHKATNKWRYHKRMYDSDESKYQHLQVVSMAQVVTAVP